MPKYRSTYSPGEIVIRDQFTTAPPKRVVQSNSGEFQLDIYDSFYRVIDLKTGALLLERAGWDPNFSPTSRFLGAFAKGAGFELWDLHSGTLILVTSQLMDRGDFRGGRVNLLAWSPGDAYAVFSVGRNGGIHVQPAIVDSSGASFPDTVKARVLVFLDACHSGAAGAMAPMMML
jgi:hypothetical protein